MNKEITRSNDYHRLQAGSFFFALVLTMSGSSLNGLLAQSSISGTVVGHNGKPVQHASVLMSVGGAEETTSIIQPDAAGRFRHQTNETGLHFLNFVGVNHQQQQVILYIDEPREVSLNVILSPPDYLDDLDGAELRSQSDKSSFNGKRLQKQSDGKYVATFETTEPSVQYIIRRATRSGEPVTGTNADEYFVLPYGGMFAVIFGVEKAGNGKVTIELDPKKLSVSSERKSPFQDDLSLDAQLTRIYREINDWKNPVTPDRAAIQRLVDNILSERDHLLRQALWMEYLGVLFPSPESSRETPPELINGDLVSKALDELTPTSPMWMLRWLSPDDLLKKAVQATNDPERYKHYMERCIEDWPYGIRGWGFAGLMKKAAEEGNTQEAERLYERLQLLSPDSEAAKWERLQRERKANARVVVGSKVPDFKAHSLEDSTIIYTPDNMRAKVYLVDFWATWCAPCVREFPYLHKAYENFKDKGFEILSYSIDPSRELVLRFRKGKFPMPWYHAIDPKFQTMDSQMVKQFEVFGIPSAFLVDEYGKIIATTEDLRGEKLEHTLKEFFQHQ